jgi:hypothetical protein
MHAATRASRLLILVVAVASCSNEPTAPTTPTEMFDVFWETFDREYSYFDYKRINWDSLRTVFRPRAEMAQSEDALVPVLKQLVAPLRDVHVQFMHADGGVVASYVPSTKVNWDENAWRVFRNSCGYAQRKPSLGYCTAAGINYLFVGSWNTSALTVADIDAAVDRFRDAPSLIIDVRPNGGGSDELSLALAGRFATATTTVGYVRFRDGRRHDSFTDEIVRRVSPRGTFQFRKPVIVLTGRGVYSSTETFISAMRELPNVTVLGDTTGGGSGNPGQHTLKSWRYSVSRWIEWTADRRVIEWKGIPPDSVVAWTASEVAAGRDPVIAAALTKVGATIR